MTPLSRSAAATISASATPIFTCEQAGAGALTFPASTSLTVTVTGSFDGGTTYTNLPVKTATGALLVPGATYTITANDVLFVDCPGATHVKVTRQAGSGTVGFTPFKETLTLKPGLKYAVIDNATSGDNTIVAAVAARKIRVHQCFLIAAAAVTIRFESGAGGTALTGQMNVAANGGFVMQYSEAGWFETAVNTLLNLELSGAVSVDGVLAYTEV